VELETVDTKIEVEVAMAVPLNGENRSIVDSGIWGGISVGSGGDPTIQPLVGDSMNTEVMFGGITGSPIKEGARVISVQLMPSQ
jgi:hypothetical protein